MSKSTHFFGQPVHGQLIKSLKKEKILAISRNYGDERYVKSFDGWHHLLTMLFAVIMRFDSLREIEAAMLAEVRKLGHIGLDSLPRRSTSPMPMQQGVRSSSSKYIATSIIQFR